MMLILLNFLYVVTNVDGNPGLIKSFVYELYASDEINGDVMSTFDKSSVQKCVALCDHTFGCLSVNFHDVNKQCKLTNYYPLDGTKLGISSDGWKIYFRRHFGMNLLSGAGAWQSSTYIDGYVHLVAEKAIDGKTATIHDCAHTDNIFSFWAVQFGTPGPVKSVKIQSRTDCCFYSQTDFRITIANSRDEVLNDAGTICGSYLGPVIDKAPFSITIDCTNTIFGRFLKIQNGLRASMVLCEVYVYTP